MEPPGCLCTAAGCVRDKVTPRARECMASFFFIATYSRHFSGAVRTGKNSQQKNSPLKKICSTVEIPRYLYPCPQPYNKRVKRLTQNPNTKRCRLGRPTAIATALSSFIPHTNIHSSWHTHNHTQPHFPNDEGNRVQCVLSHRRITVMQSKNVKLNFKLVATGNRPPAGIIAVVRQTEIPIETDPPYTGHEFEFNSSFTPHVHPLWPRTFGLWWSLYYPSFFSFHPLARNILHSGIILLPWCLCYNLTSSSTGQDMVWCAEFHFIISFRLRESEPCCPTPYGTYKTAYTWGWRREQNIYKERIPSTQDAHTAHLLHGRRFKETFFQMED